MAALTGKRKREEDIENHLPKKAVASLSLNGNGETNSHFENANHDQSISVQIVTGSYEKVLHGIHASISLESLKQSGASDATSDNAQFSDTFLFAPHTASIRCLAISTPSEESGKRMLATGSSDERINLYTLSDTPPSKKQKLSLPSLDGTTTAENSRNRSLGSLIHHERPITRLQFSARSKLFSAAEDNNIAITRCRDWTVLSSIKAPIPKPQGRPSGDTAEPGEVPAGINNFAIHPSQKLMLTVGRGEKCMRLWNLMTGKKAGVLNFDRELLALIGEGRYGSGEGRRVIWSESGESFVIGFERGAVLFGIDSMPKAIIRPDRPTKFHQIRFLPTMIQSGIEDVLAVSTEDGRVIFYDARLPDVETDIPNLPSCQILGALGGERGGTSSSRIKDFEILSLESKVSETDTTLVIVTASSDGAVRLWSVSAVQIIAPIHPELMGQVLPDSTSSSPDGKIRQVGSLVGTLETGNRITCLGAFIMNGRIQGDVDAMDEVEAEAENGVESDSESADGDDE